MMRRDAKVSLDATYNEDLTELNTTIKGNVGPDFAAFTEYETRQLKIEAWLLHVEEKLQKRQKKASLKTLQAMRLIETKDPAFMESNKFLLKRRRKKALRHIERLDLIKLQKTPEWIEANIDYIKIQHASITQGEIINGYRGTSSKTKLIDNNAMGYILKEKLPVMTVMITIQALYNALVVISVVSTISMWLAIIFQLATIFINVAIGLNYGATLFNKLDKNNLLVRRTYIMKYLMWTKPQTNKQRGVGREAV